ncbi:MAG: helix-turn-helix domain-containing protein [Bacteroidales bacterium]|nr:helix-turn-helix domain-containing protein [Candidatus Latescibacterota bacterium]
MIDDFKKASKLGYYLSKEYAMDMFRLLASYRDVSASEAASRVSIHINTAQDFLESMESLGIISRREVYERKRPYFRYSLAVGSLEMKIDLQSIVEEVGAGEGKGGIREKKNSRVKFTTARSGDAISNVVIWSGEGRDRKEHRINLTSHQGRFLYHLPFPGAETMTIDEISTKAGLDTEVLPEIVDIVGVLIEHEVIESVI